MGLLGESNPRPLAPKARIMPLDQEAKLFYIDQILYTKSARSGI